MSAERAEEIARPLDAELSDALIAHCNLSGKDIDRITEAMRSRRQSFAEAAFQLQLATRADIEDVLLFVRQHAGHQQGYVTLYRHQDHNGPIAVDDEQVSNPGFQARRSSSGRERRVTLPGPSPDCVRCDDIGHRPKKIHEKYTTCLRQAQMV